VLRSLIKPPKGRALDYIDWCQEEFGIAAALSDDENMKAAYHDGDPYMYFAKPACAAPPDATKKSHPEIREIFKECILAVQYGMGARSRFQRIGKTPAYAQQLLDSLKKMFPRYWEWLDNQLDLVMLHNRLQILILA